MDALENFAKNVPGWLKQLDDLVQKNHPGANSLRNKGSTESLRPMDGVSIFPAPEPIPDDTISDDIHSSSGLIHGDTTWCQTNGIGLRG